MANSNANWVSVPTDFGRDGEVYSVELQLDPELCSGTLDPSIGVRNGGASERKIENWCGGMRLCIDSPPLQVFIDGRVDQNNGDLKTAV